ncbi:hypothetical protein AAHA92_21744 [Salvia divinorum]|uniref:Uncharacterized protein n=1 Tax=Salvia divinorum TaxID=28513 RepID=A0ABD1GPV6_SALDI
MVRGRAAAAWSDHRHSVPRCRLSSLSLATGVVAPAPRWSILTVSPAPSPRMATPIHLTDRDQGANLG